MLSLANTLNIFIECRLNSNTHIHKQRQRMWTRAHEYKSPCTQTQQSLLNKTTHFRLNESNKALIKAVAGIIFLILCCKFNFLFYDLQNKLHLEQECKQTQEVSTDQQHLTVCVCTRVYIAPLTPSALGWCFLTVWYATEISVRQQNHSDHSTAREKTEGQQRTRSTDRQTDRHE